MNRILVAIAACLILLVVWLVVMTSGSPPDSETKTTANNPPQQRIYRTASVPSNGSEQPATIAEKLSRPQVASSAAKTDAASPPSGELPLPSELRRATQFRKALRREGERYNEATGNATVLYPAIWMDLANDTSLPANHHGGIRQIAEEFEKKIADSGLDPASPEYRRMWNDAARESDWKFRARYGARAWTRLHIQAYHLANSDSEAEQL